ncbi:MAG: disulfide bond formation protein B, partial [Hyphomicrobiales bacterium]
CMFPLALLLGIACFRSDGAAWVYALPLSLAGTAAAGYHILVYYGLVAKALQPCTRTGPSCSGEEMTLHGVVPLPVLSFAAFAAISLFLVFAARRSG